MIEITLNGESYRIASGQTLEGLVETMQLSGKALAVAVNRKVISRQQWAAHELKEKDWVDVVRAIGGG